MPTWSLCFACFLDEIITIMNQGLEIHEKNISSFQCFLLFQDYLIYLLFSSCWAETCGFLVLQPGMEPMPPAVGSTELEPLDYQGILSPVFLRKQIKEMVKCNSLIWVGLIRMWSHNMWKKNLINGGFFKASWERNMGRPHTVASFAEISNPGLPS